MTQEELLKHLPRVKNRIGAPRYRIYRTKSNKYKGKIGRWKLAFMGFVEGNHSSFDLALEDFKHKVKELNK